MRGYAARPVRLGRGAARRPSGRRPLIGLLAAFALAALVAATGVTSGAAAADTRLALVIANKDYVPAVGPLLNPHNDAALVAGALRGDGFEVDIRLDLSRGEILAAVRTHARRLADAGPTAVGLLYYAGHGASPIGSQRNYVIPVTVRDASTEALWDDSVDLERIREILTDTAPDAAQIVVFDACRNELRLPSRALGDGAGRGFRPVAEDWGGMMLAFSTAPGSVAWDGDAESGQGPYAVALAEALRQAIAAPAPVSAPELFAQIGARVRMRRPEQTPWVALGAGRLVRFGGLEPPPTPSPPPEPAQPAAPLVDPRETRLYDEAVALQSAALMETFLDAYPQSTLRAAAEARIAAWRRAEADAEADAAAAPIAETVAVQTEPAARAAEYAARETAEQVADAVADRVAAVAPPPVPRRRPDQGPAATPVAAPDGFRDCDLCPDMLALPGGQVLMGSPADEAGRGTEEGPQREIAVGAFAIGRTEISRALYDRFAADAGHQGRGCFTLEDGRAASRKDAGFAAPGWDQDPAEPAVCVSHADALAFLGWLNAQRGALSGGAPYRLPTEAEWAYAARAGAAERQPPWIWGEDASGGCAQANGHDLASDRAHDFRWPHADCDDGYARAAPVGALAANAFGLHDMIGNVWEWTADCWSGSLRGLPEDGGAVRTEGCETGVVRGGSWDDRPGFLRTAKRIPLGRSIRTHVVGLRVARDLP